MTDRYAIIGHPVGHSKSPEIHAYFARAVGHSLTYERLLAPLDGFRTTVDAFRMSGGLGANVTLPFKIDAFAYAEELTTRARQAGAVNTLKFDGSKILGDNTDGIGLCRDIIGNLNVDIAGARILVLGAGGAARGAIGPLLDAGPATIVIANRTQAKAAEIADAFDGAGTIRAVALEELARMQFDIVINATSASVTGNLPMLPPVCFRPGGLAYEMMYGKGATPFMALATAAGARTSDGLGMLIEQAAEAFLVWRGIRPATADLLTQMRAQLRGE